MKKKLFKNYSYSFDKSEKKILSTFSKQALTQMQTDERMFKEIKVFQSVLEKLNSGAEEIKLTKEEVTKLTLQLKENIKHLKTRMDSSWFIKKWFLRSVYNQYNNIITNHFEN